MKKIVLFITLSFSVLLINCTGSQGPQGPQGIAGPSSEVFELRNVNFANSNGSFTIYQQLNPNIYASDNLLVYRMTGTINSSTPIWQSVPRTLFLNNGNELDYDYDFSKVDFTIYAGGNYDISTTPQYLNNQTFRIVIIPGYFSNKMAHTVNFQDYNAVIKAFGINDKVVKILN